MKHTFLKTVSMLLSVCFLFGAMIACTGKKQSTAVYDSGKDKPTAKTVSEPEDYPGFALSDEVIMQRFWELFDKGNAAAAVGDYESFRSLFIDTDESVIRDWFNAWQQNIGDYKKRDGFIADQKDGYYWILFSTYTVTGSHPNTKYRDFNGTILVSEAGGELRFNGNSEIIVPMQIEGYKAFFADHDVSFASAVDRAGSGSNLQLFQQPLFLDSTFVFEGHFNTALTFLWQDENGDVKAAIWYANGTDVDIDVTETRLEVTDDALGTVINTTFNNPVSIRSHQSVTRIFTIPADQVKTGTQTWTSMRCECGSSY